MNPALEDGSMEPLASETTIKPEDRLSRDKDEVRTSFKEPKEAKKSRWPTRSVR